MRKQTWLWVFTVAVVIVPLLLLSVWPDLYSNPIVVFLLSVAIAVMSVVASRQEFLEDARRKTQTEWLSQAESACDRLITTQAQLVRLRRRTLCTCDDAARNLPELQQDNMRAVRTLVERNCESTGAQLQDVAEHVESALADWQRFIRKNCEGEECEQIGRALERRRAALWSAMEGGGVEGCYASSNGKRAESV